MTGNGRTMYFRIFPRLVVALAALAMAQPVFAIFHGHAHGAELPGSANPMAYGVGFVVSTGLLHLCGIMIGTLTRWPTGGRLIQGLGMTIAALGCYFLAQSLGAVA